MNSENDLRKKERKYNVHYLRQAALHECSTRSVDDDRYHKLMDVFNCCVQLSSQSTSLSLFRIN